MSSADTVSGTSPASSQAAAGAAPPALEVGRNPTVTVSQKSLDFFTQAAPKLHAYVRELQRENEELRAQNAALRADTDILDSLSDFMAALSKSDLNYAQFMAMKNKELEQAKAAQAAQQTGQLQATKQPLPPLKGVSPLPSAPAAVASSPSPSAAPSPSPSPAPPASFRVRASTPADLEAITSIYAEHVLRGTASFEEEPPALAEMQRRRDDVLARGLPYIVATLSGADVPGGDVNTPETVCAYAYAAPFRLRSAYRFTLEHSIYVRADCCSRRGIGRTLLSTLIDLLTRAGYRQLLAVIGDSANAASIGLHTRAGFKHAGVMDRVGRKFGKWLSVIIMQRTLGDGAADEPEEPRCCDAL